MWPPGHNVAMSSPKATLGQVLSRLGETLPQLADETCTRIYRELDSYTTVEREALESSVGRNLDIALAALRSGAAPAAGSLDGAVQTASERYSVGVPVEEIIRGFRISIALIHETFVDLGVSSGLPVGDVIGGSRVLWAVGDAFTTRVVTTYHELEIDARLADAGRRTAAVRAILAGEAPVDPASFAFDPRRRYAAVRCVVPAGMDRETIRNLLEKSGSLPEAPALVVLDGGACLGMVATRPQAPPSGMPIGIGPFVPTDQLPSSDRISKLSLLLARRLGRSGVQGVDELGWRLAAASYPAVWRAYADSFLTPLAGEGAFGTEVLAALTAWLHGGRSMQRAADALGVHVNTVRYRLSRYAELTGFDLDDPDDIVALTWVLELGDPDVDS